MNERRYREAKPVKKKSRFGRFKAFFKREKPQVPIPKNEYQYGVVKIRDISNKETDKWIRYKSQRDFNRQLKTILKSYSIKNYEFDVYEFQAYVEFLDKEYLDYLGVDYET